MPVCISSKYAKVGKRGAGKGEGLCKHFCDHHPELVNPGLWRNLPQGLVERVFARLPLPLIVVLRERSKAWYTMSTETGLWSIMDAGLVYGGSGSLEFGHSVPYVFDCTSETLFDLRRCASLQSVNFVDISATKDRVYVLRESEVECEDDDQMFLVLEHTWVSSTADLRQLNVFESPVEVFPGT